MKTVLITGASSGLGLAHAVYLTSLGYNVHGTSRYAEKIKREKLKEIFLRDHTKYAFSNKEKTRVKPLAVMLPDALLKNLDRILEKIFFTTMDVTDDTSVAEAVKKIGSTQAIDVLVNNAGYVDWGAVEELSVSRAEDLFAANYFGPLRVIQAVLPHFRKAGGGRIINTSSMAALVGLPFSAHYSASKSAVERLTETLRVELEPLNVSASSLLPGDINTSVNTNIVARHDQSARVDSFAIESLMDAIPTAKDSPYFARSKKMWDIFIQNHIVAPPPLLVSKQIERIIQAKKPKAHYVCGNFTQTKVLKLMRHYLSDEAFLKVLKKVFGI